MGESKENRTFRSKAGDVCWTAFQVLYLGGPALLFVLICIETETFTWGGFLFGLGVLVGLFYILGIIMWPVLLFLGGPVCKVISAAVIGFFALGIYFSFTSEKLTKAEKIRKLERELKEKELEQKYPEVVELKKQRTSILESQKKMDENIKRMKETVAQTKKSEIVAAYRSGRISKEYYDYLINDYEVCERFIFHAPQMKKDTEEMVKDIDRRIEEYRKKDIGME